MSVEVLLMADVKDLGSEGEVVNVTDGYARNYLYPRKLGAPVTAATRKRLEKIRRDRTAARETEIGKAKELAEKIGQLSCTISAKVGEEEKLFGSVTSADIVKALAAQGVDIDKQQIVLDDPLKELGVYDIKIKIHPDVDATLKVWIVEE